MLVAYLGVWMQTVGAQWQLVNAPGAGGMVALVQTAAMLPIMLFALPAGVLADVFDRRWLMFTIEVYVFVVAGILAALTAAGLTTPTVMLLFTFLLGVGGAVLLPTWQAVIPELVGRDQVGAAARLDMVGVNVGRSIGPALAGVVIAVGAVWHVFALNALSVVFLAVVLLVWKRQPPPGPRPTRERFVPALRAGTRYVRHEPVVRRILLRVVFFIVPASVMWALLPLAAKDRLGVDAGGYGALFGALGVGAVIAALAVGRLRDKLSTNALLTISAACYAGALVVVVAVPIFVLAMAALVVAGMAWAAVISTFIAELQVFLPGWVRARALAVYLVIFTGSQALASVVWGQVADLVGVLWTFVAGAALVVLGTLAGMRLAAAGDRPPEQRGRQLLARCPVGRRTATVDRTGADHGHLHHRQRPPGGLPGGHAGAPSLPPAQRLDPVGALPRRRVPRPLRRGLPGRLLGGAPASARRTAHPHRPAGRGGGVGVLRPAGAPPSTTCHRRSCRERSSRERPAHGSGPRSPAIGLRWRLVGLPLLNLAIVG